MSTVDIVALALLLLWGPACAFAVLLYVTRPTSDELWEVVTRDRGWPTFARISDLESLLFQCEKRASERLSLAARIGHARVEGGRLWN